MQNPETWRDIEKTGVCTCVRRRQHSVMRLRAYRPRVVPDVERPYKGKREQRGGAHSLRRRELEPHHT